MPEVSKAAFDYAKIAVELSLGLVGTMALFLGLMKIAQDAGMIQALARLLRPLFKFLFPKVPSDHPALGAIALNMGANMLGLGDAATPMGLKAMQELQKLNPSKDTATDAMCTFLALNSSSVQLVPVMVIGLRASSGSQNPSEIIIAAIIATTCSTIVAITAAKFFSRLPYFKKSHPPGGEP
ncbi:nucleoside recognition protein [bacterium]|nr:nucleoside recognition protein [bacterium]